MKDISSVSLLPYAHVSNHWHDYAGHWHKLGAPLRPQAEDMHIYRDELATSGETLLLGVTPEVVVLKLRGVAVDNSLSMIRTVWPSPADWEVLQGDWLRLPLRANTVDQVLGDGSLCLLRYPSEYLQVFAEISRVIRRPGKVVLRVFTAPEVSESVEEVREAVWTGRIRSFHALKWRLAMSVAARYDGVHVQAVELLRLFDEVFTDRSALLDRTGWDAEVLDTIDVYRSSSAIFSFPTAAQMDAIFRSVATTVRYRQCSYELSERCPIVILEQLRQA